MIWVIGANRPNCIISSGEWSEGATLSVPGVINFNRTAGGDNVIVWTS